LHVTKPFGVTTVGSDLDDAAHRSLMAAIVEASRDAIWSWDGDDIITSWNAEAERLLQYRAEEIIGQPLYVLVPPHRVEQAEVATRRLMQGGWYDRYETERVRKDGVAIPVELTVSPIRDADGAIAGIATICRDVSDRVLQAAALRASEVRFAQIFQLAPIAMTISTLADGRYVDVNSATLETTGYTRDEIIGRTAHELDVYADPDSFERVRALLQEEGSVRGLELGLRIKDGNVRTVIMSADVIELSGRPCLLTASVDITERKGVEAGLAASEARYRAAVITGRIAAWETDMAAGTRTWTEEGMALFGLDLPGGRGEVLGPNDEFLKSLHPDDKHMMAEFHRTADREDSYPCEYRIVRPDGTTIWVSGRGRVVARGPDGWATRVANIVVDVTDRKRAEEQVQLLLQEISHRSKNLLAVVQAIASQTARRAETLPEFQEKFIHRVQGLAASHDLLVNEKWHGAPLADLVADQLAVFSDGGARRSANGPHVVLTATAAQAIGMALHELSTNATKYGAWSDPAGTVAVSWHVDGNPPVLHLSWVESGGPPVSPPARKSFGHVVFETMVAQSVDGIVRTEYAPGGLQWHLDVPLGNVTSVASRQRGGQAPAS
jgi:PAS domain S-box-containing protein